MKLQMKRSGGGKTTAQALVLALFLVLGALIAYAASFQFSPDPNAVIFNLSEDTGFYYDINVSVNESLILFSSNAQDLGFFSFSLNNATGIINFTPPNSEVGYYSVTLIAENRSNSFDKVVSTVGFNVTNTNDAPNITQYSPVAESFTLFENTSQGFSFNFSDDDSIHGDAINSSWYRNGTLLSLNRTLNYTPGFCEGGQVYNITLVINDTSNANDTQTWQFGVSNTNRPPSLNATISNRRWFEGSNLTNNLTLNLFFSDEDALECSGTQQDNLTYSSLGNSSILVIINSSSTNTSFLAAPNFFGNETVNFTASDGTNTTRSNPVLLNIININGPPQFNATNQTLYVDIAFTYDLNATDPDNEIMAGFDTLTYYDNASVFDINPSTGVITFTPSQAQLGAHPINISVDDGIVNVSNLVIFNITQNSAPNMSAIGNKNATEGIIFRMNATATDADNDSLTFSSNFSAFSIFHFNSTAANLSFLPLQSHVGNHSVRITVTDSKGTSVSENITLMVENVNNAPNLTRIANQTARIDRRFLLNITAYDQDSTNLSFFENSTLFDFSYTNISAALISFIPVAANIGNHTINLTVGDGEVNDSQIVVFMIINNTPPVLQAVGNQTLVEDSNIIIYLNATDGENDTLLFYANTSMFSITYLSANSSLINFTPTQNHTGIHVINITVNDTPLIESLIMVLNITAYNDTPQFLVPIPNLTGTYNAAFFYDVNATDEENDSLTFSDNATFFSIAGSTGIISFTPALSDVGNHSINISVTDGSTSNTSTITFVIYAANQAPVISSYIPLNTSNISAAEGGSLLFNVTATDPDGETINYSWRINGTQRSANQSYLYEPSFSEAGIYNVSVEVSDGSLQALNQWNLTVNNTNRIPTYGKVNRTTEADFSAGSLYQVNVTGQSGNITLARSDGSNYFSSGNFTSAVIDLQASSNLTLLNISWKESRPQNTSIIFQIRTSRDNVTYSNFSNNSTGLNYSNPNGTSISAQSNRYVQFRAILSTNNTNDSPAIEEVIITYKASDFAGREDTVYLTYLDLDDFFADPDSDDSLTYNVSDTDDIEISIDSAHRVSITPDSDFAGTRTAVFTLSDGYGTILSNNISFTFADVSEPGSSTTTTTTSSGGGGGGGGGSSTKTIIINQTDRKKFELIVPQSVTMKQKERFIATLILRNNEEFALNGISLTAESNRDNISFEFS
ncbi:MAG: Ig family protein, partial [Candidatus Uhrbacteria bacterium GW2011_GWA2_53_10]